MSSTFKAIIFDFDNTLVESHINFPAMKISMAQLVRKHGLDLGANEDIPNRYTAGNIIDEAKKFDESTGTNLVPELWELVENFERLGMEDINFNGEIVPILEALKAKGIILTLLTNNSKQPTIEVLERFALLDYFTLIITRNDITKMKPDKEGIELILEKISLSSDEVVLVGDSWVDGKAAKNANISFILFREELLDTVKYDISIWKHITKMSELIEII